MARPKKETWCKEDGCQRMAVSRGFCSTHYMVWYRAHNEKCKIEGCEEHSHAKGLCHRHYSAIRRNSLDGERPEPQMNHPSFLHFLYKFPRYDVVIDGIKSRRDMPLYELEERGLIQADSQKGSGEWRDVPMRDRISHYPRNPDIQESGIIDWSKK